MAKKNTKETTAAAVDSTKVQEIVEILEVQEGVVDFCLLGRPGRGLMFNRKSDRVQRDLLYPRGRLNATEKALRLKHNPVEEFRASVHRLLTGPTLLVFPAVAFKSAMATAALDLPETRKAQIERLVWVTGDYVHIYGTPKLHMTDVVMGDIGRTPDIRTRAYLPQWACRITVTFVKPLMRPQAIARLLAASGLYIGVGDGRNAKGGKKTWGGYSIVEPTDQEFIRLTTKEGRAAQVEALQSAEPYDDPSAELLEWFETEYARRTEKGNAATAATPDVDAMAVS
jgi:hypothetical protein